MENTIERRNRNTNVGNLNNSRRVLTLIFFSTVFTTTGCAFLPSHFHDAEKAAVATRLEKELTAYDENAPSMYEAMLANLEKFRVEEDRVIADLAANRDKALITRLPTRSGKQLCEDANEVAKDILKLKRVLKKEATEYQEKSLLLKEEIHDVTDAVEKAKNAVDDAKGKVTEWNKAIAVLKKGFSELPSLAERNKNDPTKSDLSSLIKDLGRAGDKEIEFLDADGNSQKRTLKDILKDQIEKGKDNWLKILFPEAPGITTTIMILGLDLAELKKKEAEFELARRTKRAELYEETDEKIRLASQLLADSELARVPEKVPETEEEQKLKQDLKQCQKNNKSREASYLYVLNTVAKARDLSQQINKTEGKNRVSETQKLFEQISSMKERLKGLRRIALADSITKRTKTMLNIDVARLEHEESILRSRAHDEMWRVSLKSGIAGLVAYHQGGFSDEDAAQIIRIAQTVALGVIAHGVN